MSHVAFRSDVIDTLSCELDVVFGTDSGDVRTYVIIHIWIPFHCDEGEVGWESSTNAFPRTEQYYISREMRTWLIDWQVSFHSIWYLHKSSARRSTTAIRIVETAWPYIDGLLS